ncbi:MAG: hypothetical protein QXT38_04130 [Candidatus Aenigmatarchaeota archaeon]
MIEFSREIQKLKRKEVVDLIIKHRIVDKYYDLKNIFYKILHERDVDSALGFEEKLEKNEEYKEKHKSFEDALKHILHYLCESEGLENIFFLLPCWIKSVEQGAFWIPQRDICKKTNLCSKFGIVIYIIRSEMGLGFSKDKIFLEEFFTILTTLIHEFTHYYLYIKKKDLKHSEDFCITFHIFFSKYLDVKEICKIILKREIVNTY